MSKSVRTGGKRPFAASNGHAGPPVAQPRVRDPGKSARDPAGWRRRLGKVLVVLGLLLVAYSVTVVLWKDPATDLYTRWRQHQLAGELEKEFAAYAAALTPSDEQPPSGEGIAEHSRQRVASAANAMNERLRLSKPLGRIIVPRLDVNAIFVQGTRWGPDLSQGPGHYAQTSLPGVGRTVAIAGHRTTFGAWFRHIDSLKAGDEVALRLPYATFTYKVFDHTIVDNDDWSIIRERGFETLVLSACHPLYSASHRWIVFAALVRVDPVEGVPYAVDRRNHVSSL